MQKFEKLIKDIVESSSKKSKKVHEFTFTEDDVKGDLKSFKDEITDVDIRVVDNGIGSYEYWGNRGFDRQIEPEINDGGCADVKIITVGEDANGDIKDLVDILLDWADVDKVLKFESEGRRSVFGDFEIQLKNIKKRMVCIHVPFVMSERQSS
jgi:hypothetical protein